MTQRPQTLEEWQAFTKKQQAEKSAAAAAPAPVLNNSGASIVVDSKIENRIADLDKRVHQLQNGEYGFSTAYSDWRPKVEEMLAYQSGLLNTAMQAIELLQYQMSQLETILDVILAEKVPEVGQETQ
jgi:hypothetical protein